MENHPDITWTSTMHQLIPDDFVLQSEYATTHVTLEDCLSHRSGLPGHHAQLGAKSVQEATRLLRHLSFTKEPRTEWQYSNHMYWAVSHMIEVQTGKSLEQFMTQRLWRPLEMDNTFLSLENADAHTIGRPHMSLAKSYQWDETINKLSPLPYWDDIGMSGAGALVSTVSDQAKWLRSFINRNGPLSHAGYEALTSPHMLMPPTSARFQGPHCYGMGWFIARYHGELVLFHPGGTVGFAANVILLPELNWGVVGMCNGSSDGILDVPMWHLVDEFLEIPFDRRINVFQE
jgi:CubicO group peptidase (beta-lactamase class C family)